LDRLTKNDSKRSTQRHAARQNEFTQPQME